MAKIYFEILNKDVCNYSKKPTPATMSLPEWWKKMKKHNFDIFTDLPLEVASFQNATIRSCPAVNDSFNFGYMLYIPLDVYIDATKEDEISWYVPDVNLSIYGDKKSKDYIGFHDNSKMVGFKNDEVFHKHAIKLNTFFGIKTEKGYSTWVTHPIGRNDLPFKMIDGIIDTDKFPSRFPYAMFIKKGFKGIIKKDTPLVQIIPFKRESFEAEFIDSDLEDIRSIEAGTRAVFLNGYKKLFWSRKIFK
jgi:hypothetical protein